MVVVVADFSAAATTAELNGSDDESVDTSVSATAAESTASNDDDVEQASSAAGAEDNKVVDSVRDNVEEQME